MFVGTLSMALRLPSSQTLKDKRSIVRSILDVARRRFGVAAAEVDDLGLSGNATLAFAAVSSNKVQVEATLAAVREFVDAHVEVEAYDCVQEIESR